MRRSCFTGKFLDKVNTCVKVFQQMLTALDRMGGYLEGDVLSSWLRNVHTEHQTDTRVLPADVRLALPQLDVGVPELQDPDTVDSVRVGARTSCVNTCEGINTAVATAGGCERLRSHIAFMLFFGSRGISRTLVPWMIFSKLVVVTVLPVMRWT